LDSRRSPESPVARTREGLRSTTRSGEFGRNVDARVNFSEARGDGGDTGDTGCHPAGNAADLRQRLSSRGVGSRGPEAGLPDVDAGHGAPRREPTVATASAADQLRALASRVRRVGLAGRFDPEAAYRAGRAGSRAAPARGRARAQRWRTFGRKRHVEIPAVSPRRIAAVLAAKTSEIASLRALLAQAVRPARPRQRVTSEAQLTLPLLETTDEG
jgi:hypothetical protein